MKSKTKVCVVGQGFAGLPMSIAASNSRNNLGELNFKVIGIEKNNLKGNSLKEKVNSGKFPIKCDDKKIHKKFKQSINNKNFYISTNFEDIKNSNVIIISISFEIHEKKKISFHFFKKFIY